MEVFCLEGNKCGHESRWIPFSELIGGGCKIIIEAAGERFGVAALKYLQ